MKAARERLQNILLPWDYYWILSIGVLQAVDTDCTHLIGQDGSLNQSYA